MVLLFCFKNEPLTSVSSILLQSFAEIKYIKTKEAWYDKSGGFIERELCGILLLKCLTQSLRIGNLFKEMGKIFKTATLFKLLCLLQ